jgi:hypothetical protein
VSKGSAGIISFIEIVGIVLFVIVDLIKSFAIIKPGMRRESVFGL